VKISYVNVVNYKGLKNITTPISNFICVIGENNAGKSSLLQAILLFLRGNKISKSEFYNPSEEIRIEVSFSGITDDALEVIADEHREKIKKYIKNGNIEFVRKYIIDGSSELRIVSDVPIEEKYSQEVINDSLRGKTGNAIITHLRNFYSEFAAEIAIDSATTITKAKELLNNYIENMPSEKLKKGDVPLPTGIENSVRAIFPEPIYIPAVKDLTDDLKTKEAASFGKLLNILLNVIEEDLTEATETFENIRKKLNRVIEKDGSISDERLEKVKDIEKTIQKNLQETFRNVSIELEVPPPEIKTVLANATIIADDGVRGTVDQKGDGFKRAIAFSILRSYVQLSQNAEWQKKNESKNLKNKFIFLFEEPELYLHPRAQNILFDALSLISNNHQVAVTTHSPMFFSSEKTTTFIKIIKNKNEGYKPFGMVLPVNISDISERDKFQLISFEASNVAFFSNKILLVEGDSEMIVLPHIAKTLNHNWNFKTSSISLVKINGKGSFKRYLDFFSRFNVDVYLLADLDIILKDFDKVNPDEEMKNIRVSLIQEIDKLIEKESLSVIPKASTYSDELSKERAKKIISEIIETRKNEDMNKTLCLLEELFVFEKNKPRYSILKRTDSSDITQIKDNLLGNLREKKIFVLEKGEIEEYYPNNVIGTDKPSKAQDFCKKVKSADEIRKLFSNTESSKNIKTEIDYIMEALFET